MTGQEFKEAIGKYIAKKGVRGKQLTYADIAALLKIDKKELYRRFRSKGLYQGWLAEAEIILHLDTGELNEPLADVVPAADAWSLLKECNNEKIELQRVITELQHQLQSKKLSL